ncbi:MAG: Asp-tRNA(Asn)/Glu-tRNA(Gln) amidotransferase subunit GatC [Candidatus Omnitrophica bacterium]|nr:Asp-tRNA(Asn)/Glu-tRNA(Gln) amidotransferase subunit GatC [Candidatus Omnitrophota bacterium]
MSVVTPAEVRAVAWLARIDVPEDRLPQVAAQLDDILAYVRKLQAIPTQSVEPTSHVLPLSNVTRADQPVPPLPAEQAVRLAPDQRGHLVRVPKVVDVG